MRIWIGHIVIKTIPFSAFINDGLFRKLTEFSNQFSVSKSKGLTKLKIFVIFNQAVDLFMCFLILFYYILLVNKCIFKILFFFAKLKHNTSALS